MASGSNVKNYELLKNPAEQLVDKKAELQALKKQLQKIEQEVAVLEAIGHHEEQERAIKFPPEVEKKFKRRREKVLKRVEGKIEGTPTSPPSQLDFTPKTPVADGQLELEENTESEPKGNGQKEKIEEETDSSQQKKKEKGEKSPIKKQKSKSLMDVVKKKKGGEKECSSSSSSRKSRKERKIDIPGATPPRESITPTKEISPAERPLARSLPPGLKGAALPPPLSPPEDPLFFEEFEENESPAPNPRTASPTPRTSGVDSPSPTPVSSSRRPDLMIKGPLPSPSGGSEDLLFGGSDDEPSFRRRAASPDQNMFLFEGSDNEISPRPSQELLFGGSDDELDLPRSPRRGNDGDEGDLLVLRTASEDEDWSAGNFEFDCEENEKRPEPEEEEEEEDDPEFQESMKMHDWNTRFQNVINTLQNLSYTDDSTLQKRVEANQELMHLSQDFVHAARTYGRIIISEVYLPMKRKTIKPLNLGGVAGGEKYIVHNILFKFAVDSGGLFGNNNISAAKVGGLELKGLMAYFSLGMDSLNLPMMALVDYRGFRLIAMSVLPLRGMSLIYGSKDAGNTVYATDSDFNAIMEKAGRSLNLINHQCGLEPNKLKELWAACDIEGHLGSDGNFYLLDFSRTMPPVTPKKGVVAGHLFRIFRKEFVQNYKIPLCSDGFSGFCMNDPKFKEMNADLREATNHLMYDVVPDFAMQYVEMLEQKAPSDISLTREMHKRGINMRYLGLLYSALLKLESEEFSETVTAARRLVLIEATARILKNTLNLALQDKMKELRLPLEIPYRQEVVRLINLWFEETMVKEGMEFWDDEPNPDGMKALLKRDFEFRTFTFYDPTAIGDQEWKSLPVKKLESQKEIIQQFRQARVEERSITPTLSGPLKAGMSLPAFSRTGTLKEKDKEKQEKEKEKSEKSKKRKTVNLSPIAKFEKKSATDSDLSERPEFLDIKKEDKGKIVDRSVSRSHEESFSLKRFLFFDRFNLREHPIGGRWLLFSRFIRLVGLTVTDGTSNRFKGEKGWRFNPIEPLSLLDLKEMEGRVKHMNIVSAAAGTFFQHKGLAPDQKEFASEHFREAIERYEESLEADPQDKAVLFFIALTWYKLLRELSGKSETFVLADPGVLQTCEHFLEALEADPQNRMALCSFAEFADQCGMFEVAEDFFLRTLEFDPKYSYALVRYGNFLCRRDVRFVGQMFLEKGGQAAGTDGTIDALTGKQVGGAVRVYFIDGTKKTVQATPATTTVDLLEALKRVIIHRLGKTVQPRDVELIESQFRILSLHERSPGDSKGETIKERERPMKETEKPWLILQKPGQKSELVVKPLRLPLSAKVTLMDHYLNMLSLLVPSSSMPLIPESYLEFEKSLSSFNEQLHNLVDPIFRAGNYGGFKKLMNPPSKKVSTEWIALNMTICSRIAVMAFETISHHCTCEEMTVNEKGTVADWSSKTGSKLQKNIRFAPPTFADSYKNLFAQLIQTSLNPALKNIIKPKKFVSDMCEVASKISAVLLHACTKHQNILKKLTAWDLPILPLVAYVFFFFTDNGLLDKKADSALISSFLAQDSSLR